MTLKKQDSLTQIRMSDEEDNFELFKDPDDFYEPEKPCTFQECTLKGGQNLKLRFVGHNPLWVSLIFHLTSRGRIHG